ncbi:MAG: lipid-A-disaccharide synthase [Chlorobi bacterium]|nr:lipid-A-disaccharide synthase [Chlorobiota bacterium]
MKIWVSAGELSGDLRASEVIESIQQLTNVSLKGIGGQNLLNLGLQPLETIDNLGHVGFVEVIKHIPFYLKLLRRAKDDILSWQPNVVLLVDYPGFNMRLLKSVGRHVPVAYYIIPQVWAWLPQRAKALRLAKAIFTILPFEKDFLARYGIHSHYVGHPLAFKIKQYVPNGLPWKDYIALLPGSRTFEIKNILPIMLQVAKNLPYETFVIAGIPKQKALIESILLQHNLPNVNVVYDRTYDVLAHAQYAIVTSGTASLETALFKVPEIVLYKGNWLSYLIARTLITVNFISLPNLILNEPLIPELIQQDCSPQNILKHLEIITSRRKQIIEGYNAIENILFTDTPPPQKVAQILVDLFA